MKRLMALRIACAAFAGLFAMGQAAAEDAPLTVGAIYVGSVNDYGYNRAMKDGLDEMKKNVIAHPDGSGGRAAGKCKPFKVRRMAWRAPMVRRLAVSMTDLMSA